MPRCRRCPRLSKPNAKQAPNVDARPNADADASSTSTVDPRAFRLVKAAYSVREVMELLGIGRTSLYAAVHRGELRRIKLGKRTLFCATDLAAFLVRLRSQETRARGGATSLRTLSYRRLRATPLATRLSL
jgi:excisionase family DNA binding protein